MRVLVVEDEEHVGALFREFLTGLGHASVVVRTAEAALGKLQTEPPDAIILDLNLPGMSGLDFLRLAPVRDSGLPIVAVSGIEEEAGGRRLESLQLGALDFLVKPIPVERLAELLRVVESHPGHRRSPQAGAVLGQRVVTRVPIEFPVRAAEYQGQDAEATAVELSPFGVKIRTEASLGGEAAVRLTLGLPDGGPPVDATALLLRRDADGLVFAFVGLPAPTLHRLADLVDRQS